MELVRYVIKNTDTGQYVTETYVDNNEPRLFKRPGDAKNAIRQITRPNRMSSQTGPLLPKFTIIPCIVTIPE